MKKTLILFLILTLLGGMLGAALAVTYTEDGAMIVSGDGDDDFSNIGQVTDPGASYTTVILPGENTEAQIDENGNLVVAGPGPTFAPGGVLDVFILGEDGELQPVKLLSVGSLYSRISIQRKVSQIPTRDLIFEMDENVPEEMRFASINAKRTGLATMHLRGSVKSDVVGRYQTNKIVLVLSLGRLYTKVWCDGSVGYIKTSSLSFYGAPDKDTTIATMAYKGRTKSRNTINIRQNGKSNSRILTDIPCGARLTVLGYGEESWVEVEVNGWRAWVQEKYIYYGSGEAEYAELSPSPAPALVGDAAQPEGSPVPTLPPVVLPTPVPPEMLGDLPPESGVQFLYGGETIEEGDHTGLSGGGTSGH